MANYNCSDSADNTYGAGEFGTCTSQSVGAPGAPNTGVFNQVLGGASFTVVAPLAAAIILVVVVSLFVRRRKKQSDTTPTK